MMYHMFFLKNNFLEVKNKNTSLTYLKKLIGVNDVSPILLKRKKRVKGHFTSLYTSGTLIFIFFSIFHIL